MKVQGKYGAFEKAIEEGTKLTKKPHKYRITKTEYNGRMYDSPAEANHAKSLDEEKDAGLVAWWLPQVRIELGIPENVYVIDFLVGFLREGKLYCVEAIDIKGFETPKFRKTKKLWAKYGPFPLRVIHVKSGKIVETEVINSR